MATITLARNAMATRFEVVLHGEDPVSLRAAGEEALQEIERLEAQLSLFRPSSEIAHLNARASREAVRVTPPLFALLHHAATLTRETGGTFDITIAPLVRCWGFHTGAGRRPSPAELAGIRERVGMEWVEFNEQDFTVRFKREGVMIDLGAIGKGYAVEKAVELLRDAGVTSALIHGGTSTVYALGSPPDAAHWTVGLPIPTGRSQRRQLTGAGNPSPSTRALLTNTEETAEARFTIPVPLRDEALSVSAIWGRFFEDQGEVLGHIIDPRTGAPAKASSIAAVVLPSATETDALSTALLTLGVEEHQRISSLRPGIRTLVGAGSGEAFRAASQGIAWDQGSNGNQLPV